MTSRLSDVVLDLADGVAPDPNLEQERRVAVFDLLEQNTFTLPEGPKGPYKLRLAQRDGQLVFDLATERGRPAAAFRLSLGPLRQVVKDYAQICGSYYEAVVSKPPAEIEALDEARRGIHREGAQMLQDRLEGKAHVDDETARRLFTLVCVLCSEN